MTISNNETDIGTEIGHALGLGEFFPIFGHFGASSSHHLSCCSATQKFEIGKTDEMTLAEGEERIADCMDCYNDERCQKRLGNVTPIAYARKLKKLDAYWN